MSNTITTKAYFNNGDVAYEQHLPKKDGFIQTKPLFEELKKIAEKNNLGNYGFYIILDKKKSMEADFIYYPLTGKVEHIY